MRRRPNKRLAALGKVVKKFEGWKPPREVLTNVRSVPTIFPQFNVATRVGGCPIQRIIVIHGPSNMGKTAALHGLGLSFLQRDNIYGLVDAEFTTPTMWLDNLMGSYVDHPGFLAQRPENHEETRHAVSNLLTEMRAARREGELPDDMAALIGIDSLRKLIPKGLVDKVAAEKDGADGAQGRAGQHKAKINAAWLDELVPLAYHCNACIAIIAREIENTDAGKFSPRWKLSGGSSLAFDSSLTCRVERDDWVKKSSAKGAPVVGERHKISIRKTKIGGKDDKVTVCYFHTSNGVLIPEGFDRSRDVVDMARQAGLLKMHGSKLVHTGTGEVLGTTAEAVVLLTEKSKALAKLEVEARAAFKPEEADEEMAGDSAGDLVVEARP